MILVRYFDTTIGGLLGCRLARGFLSSRVNLELPVFSIVLPNPDRFQFNLPIPIPFPFPLPLFPFVPLLFPFNYLSLVVHP